MLVLFSFNTEGKYANIPMKRKVHLSSVPLEDISMNARVEVPTSWEVVSKITRSL